MNLIKCVAVSMIAMATLCTGAAARADTTLVNDTDRQQLAGWLGKDTIQLTNIFTKTTGSTAADFHAAADGKGATIVVMEAVTKSGQSFLLGGYNPSAWASSGGYAVTNEDSLRTAFLFNLTSDTIFRQMLSAQHLETLGSYQTLNEAGMGPTFGWGHDLQMAGDLTRGSSLLYSYADASLSNMNLSIADGQAYRGIDDLAFGRVEVYTISAVPEPASLAMLALGLCVMAARAGRKR